MEVQQSFYFPLLSLKCVVFTSCHSITVYTPYEWLIPSEHKLVKAQTSISKFELRVSFLIIFNCNSLFLVWLANDIWLLTLQLLLQVSRFQHLRLDTYYSSGSSPYSIHNRLNEGIPNTLTWLNVFWNMIFQFRNNFCEYHRFKRSWTSRSNEPD